MLETLLRTKLFVPPVRRQVVRRPHLIERLNQGLQLGHKLTLVSAPAGFGKTTLISDWVQPENEETELIDEEGELHPTAFIRHPSSVAWLSLDADDSDPTRFLTYLVAALQTLAPSEVDRNTAHHNADDMIGAKAAVMLQSPQPPSSEAIVTVLINDIMTASDSFILVLDDYHAIDATEVDDALSFLLQHLPPQMHLVIATREDPLLPLSRLRARGQLTELRAADLRFSSGEAVEFLNQLMGLNLSTADIRVLETRTEGWVAGLQLAALSLQGKDDVTGLIRSFSGSNRLVLDYLIEEVLNQQPQSVQTFLLQTAILDRLAASLCDALTGQDDGQATLEMLERANLFIVPQDEERRWYRYHHLFGDLLRRRLRQIDPDLIPTLHGRASDWYAQHDQPFAAVRHALAAGDFERTASLAELTWLAMEGTFQSAAWLGWVEELPEELIRARPVLGVQYAQALQNNGELEASELWLQEAERWLNPTGDMRIQPQGSTEPLVVVDEAQFHSLPATVAITRALNAQIQGDSPGTVTNARLALDLIPEEDHFLRAQATVLLGFTHWASGDLEAAHGAIAGWIESMQNVGNIFFAVASAFGLADIMVAQGKLKAAVETYDHALQLASEQDGHFQRIIAHHHLGLAMLYHEMHQQEAFALHLQKSKELGKQSTLIDWPYRRCVASARLNQAAGELDDALDLLDEASRVYVRNPTPDIRPTGALKTQIYLKQGNFSQAQAWVRQRNLSAADDLSYVHEFEHITLARVMMAEYERGHEDRSLVEALDLLDRLLEEANARKRGGSTIEILIMLALAYQAQGDIPRALTSLQNALTLAEPEGYLQIFVDEGPPMARLLLEAHSQGIEPHYAQRLLAAFPAFESKARDSSFSPAPNAELVEQLSQRELEVLQLVAEGLNNPEIASRLYLSPNTVKVHTRNIFGKLDVHNRFEAVARARALGILPQK